MPRKRDYDGVTEGVDGSAPVFDPEMRLHRIGVSEHGLGNYFLLGPGAYSRLLSQALAEEMVPLNLEDTAFAVSEAFSKPSEPISRGIINALCNHSWGHRHLFGLAGMSRVYVRGSDKGYDGVGGSRRVQVYVDHAPIISISSGGLRLINDDESESRTGYEEVDWEKGPIGYDDFPRKKLLFALFGKGTEALAASTGSFLLGFHDKDPASLKHRRLSFDADAEINRVAVSPRPEETSGFVRFRMFGGYVPVKSGIEEGPYFGPQVHISPLSGIQTKHGYILARKILRRKKDGSDDAGRMGPIIREVQDKDDGVWAELGFKPIPQPVLKDNVPGEDEFVYAGQGDSGNNDSGEVPF